MRILFVDHQDSFSNNLIADLRTRGAHVDIIQSAELVVESALFLAEKYQMIVLSPGPGHPLEYPNTVAFYSRIPASIPVFGVCLGMQVMAFAEGATIRHSSALPVHGRRISLIEKKPSRVLSGKELDGTFVCYNSLGCHVSDFSALTQWNCLGTDGSCVMAMEHKQKPHLGVQFHPESFASTGGVALLQAITKIVL